MTALLDRKNCIGCGFCTVTCPEVFQTDGNGFATIIRQQVPKEAERSALAARDQCPVRAICLH